MEKPLAKELVAAGADRRAVAQVVHITQERTAVEFLLTDQHLVGVAGSTRRSGGVHGAY